PPAPRRRALGFARAAPPALPSMRAQPDAARDAEAAARVRAALHESYTGGLDRKREEARLIVTALLNTERACELRRAHALRLLAEADAQAAACVQRHAAARTRPSFVELIAHYGAVQFRVSRRSDARRGGGERGARAPPVAL